MAAQGGHHPPGTGEFLGDELFRRGYEPVYTPHIGRVELYRTSGHYPYYADSQFKPIEMKDGEQYLLKPMNCPHHIMIYQSKPRSYRDLPVRLAEFGTVYRYEQSGELGGMTRVRGFTQDDAHLFCTEEQVADEFRGCMEMTQFMLEDAGHERLSRAAGVPRSGERQIRRQRRESGTGRRRRWRRSAASMNLRRQRGAGRGGILRAQGRLRGHRLHRPRVAVGHRATGLQPAQRRTIRSGIHRAGQQPHRPVMIHRAPFGSMERFIGVLIEHFAGAFPLWLAPEQVRVLVGEPEVRRLWPATSKQRLRKAGLRVTGDYRAEKIGAKIRDAQLKLIPYMFVIGGREAEQAAVAVRHRARRGIWGVCRWKQPSKGCRRRSATR